MTIPATHAAITAVDAQPSHRNQPTTTNFCVLSLSGCKWGKRQRSIHDLSRKPLGANNLLHFNMPFELELALGAKRFGQRKSERMKIMVDEQYQQPTFPSRWQRSRSTRQPAGRFY
jgi:hypothetical protein